MGTTPNNQLRYADVGDAPNMAVISGNLAADLDTRLVPKFASSGSRDSTLTALSTGLVCAVDGVLQVYNDGAWRNVMQTRAAVVTRTANSAVPTGAVSSTAVPWNTTESNLGATTGSSGITVPLSGLYRISAAGQFEPNATGVRHVEITVGGSFITGLSDQRAAVSGFSSSVAVPSTSRVFTAGDIVSAAVWQTSGGSLNLTYARLSVEFAGA